jgi:hypothetical protein
MKRDTEGRDIPVLSTASARSTSIAFTHSGSKSREGAGEGAVGGCEGTDGLAEHVGDGCYESEMEERG